MTRAVFVGINKHSDPQIPELSGAGRDATALWALFTDTIEGLSSRLLIDEEATFEATKEAILGTLSRAADDDVVILSFAGHGSPDGHLICFDTNTADLPSTALAMSDLSDAFKQSRARVILCILDCCFSGQAPARVLESIGHPRNAFIFSEISGEGRILLAACAANESAWEQPGTGHGLLTYSIIQAMSGGPSGSGPGIISDISAASAASVSFPEIAGDIIKFARTEADRMKVTQTPVFLGSVQGGLTFPLLRRGENFRASFPSLPAQLVSGDFDELADLGISAEVVANWKLRFPQGLNALQVKAVNDYGVLQGRSLLVVAPTSSGKTMIGELAAVQAVASGKKAAFLLPYKALVNEKYQEFNERYGSTGLRVVRCSGDASDGIPSVLNGRYDLGFFTYETFLNLALVSPRLLNQLGLVVLDEGQFITDPSRGITVELILALILRAGERGIEPQMIVLSAVIGKLNNFDRWLNLPLLKAIERPVPLIEGVLDRRGTFQFVDTDKSTRTEQLLQPFQIVQRKEKPGSQDVIVPLAKQLVSQGEKIIIFRNTRGPAQGCAKYLSHELGLGPAQGVITTLPSQDLTGASQDLRECLRGGTAFHNTNLLRGEREAIENGFRNPNGGIHVLAATTTLAAGINTPASTVILAENEFKGEDGRPFTVAEYKNMAGRAGRLGFNETGKAIILADTPMERAHLFQKYVLGVPEDVVSSFQRNDLPTWTLRLLSQVRGIKATEVPGLLANTYGGYCASLANPQWAHAIQSDLNQFVNRLLQAGLAEMEGELIHLTLLGRACGASSLSFESGLRLVELMKRVDIATVAETSILAIVQVLPEMDGIYTPVMKRGQAETVRVTQVNQRYGFGASQELQKYARDQFEFLSRCKRAAIIWDWIEGTPVDELERRFTTNFIQGVIGYGDIVRIVEGTRFHLRSAHQILAALFPETPNFLTRLDEVLLRLELGLPSSALPLTESRLILTRGQYLALLNAGCKGIGDINNLPDQELIACIGVSDAQRMKPSLKDPLVAAQV
jgi:ATP-dependent DNA helicase